MTLLRKIIAWWRKFSGLDLYDANEVLLIPFDGEIHPMAFRFVCDHEWDIPGRPVEGAIKRLQDNLPVPDAFGLSEPYTKPIAVITSWRSETWRGRRAMRRWLIKNGLPRQYIDDGLLRFVSYKEEADGKALR